MASAFYYGIDIAIILLCFAHEFMSIKVSPVPGYKCYVKGKTVMIPETYTIEEIESCIEGTPISLNYSSQIRADGMKNWKPSMRFSMDYTCKDDKNSRCLNLTYTETKMEGRSASLIEKQNFNEAQQFGAFLNDHKKLWVLTLDKSGRLDVNCDAITTTMTTETTMTITTESTPKATKSIPTTSPTTETTTSKCADPKWVSVRVAKVTDISKDNISTVQDYAVHVGYEQFNHSHSLTDMQIQEKVNELLLDLHEAADNEETKKEIQQWLEENKEWLPKLKVGEFRYVRVYEKKLFRDDMNKQRTIMLMYNCDFGNFLMAPIKKQPNMVVEESKLDWSKEFYHLEQCVVKTFDMTEHLDLGKRISWITTKKFFKKINLKVGLEITNPGLQLEPSCEAFKYKYGYSDPLREPSLNDTYNDYDRVKKFGHYLLPIEEVCNPPKGHRLSAEMWQLRRNNLLEGYARRVLPTEEDADCDAEGVCLKCLVKSCYPTLEWSLLQPAVFECNDFTFWTPRVKSRLKYTVVDLNGQSITIERQFVAKTFDLDHKKIEVPTSLAEYKLYEIMKKQG